MAITITIPVGRCQGFDYPEYNFLKWVRLSRIAEAAWGNPTWKNSTRKRKYTFMWWTTFPKDLRWYKALGVDGIGRSQWLQQLAPWIGQEQWEERLQQACFGVSDKATSREARVLVSQKKWNGSTKYQWNAALTAITILSKEVQMVICFHWWKRVPWIGIEWIFLSR